MPAFFRRMLRIGNLPADLRAQVESEGILALGENLAVVSRFSGSVPGSSAANGISRWAGAVAITSTRIVATLAVRSDPALPAADCRWDCLAPAAMQIEIAGAGLTLDVDLAAVDPAFRGQLSLRYRLDIPPATLARLPALTLRQDVPPGFVYQALGVRPPG